MAKVDETTYRWTVPGVHKVDAVVAGQAIKALGGKATPKQLLDSARDPNSPLHAEFEWNDGVAAERYREQQARKILVDIIVEVRAAEEHEPVAIRAFVPYEKRAYVPVETIINSDDGYAAMMAQALKELEAFRLKYYRLTALREQIEEILKENAA